MDGNNGEVLIVAALLFGCANGLSFRKNTRLAVGLELKCSTELVRISFPAFAAPCIREDCRLSNTTYIIINIFNIG